MATWASNLPRLERIAWDALSAGVAAAGHEYADAVSARLKDGYTSGDFVTGHVAGSVEVTPVERTVDGIEVRVGSNVDYALFWELGHVNIFTARKTATVEEFFSSGGFQRVEIWRPFLLEMADQLRETIRRTATAMIQGQASEVSVLGTTREQIRERMRNVVER